MQDRIYKCKSEEVPVAGKYLLFLLRRDLDDFSRRFPKLFTREYVAGIESKIDGVNNLLNPQTETVELKNTTNRLYATMDSLIEPLNIVKGYVQFSKGAVSISVKDFGITTLKQRIHHRDAEGTLKNLRTVIANVEKYRSQLLDQGFDETVSYKFTQALPVIENENQRQFEIVNKRKNIVEKNVEQINDLYKIIIEVCNAGKTIYKNVDASKVKDYTFNELIKKVRVK